MPIRLSQEQKGASSAGKAPRCHVRVISFESGVGGCYELLGGQAICLALTKRNLLACLHLFA
jgi:hypothetical protein